MNAITEVPFDRVVEGEPHKPELGFPNTIKIAQVEVTKQVYAGLQAVMAEGRSAETPEDQCLAV